MLSVVGIITCSGCRRRRPHLFHIFPGWPPSDGFYSLLIPISVDTCWLAMSPMAFAAEEPTMSPSSERISSLRSCKGFREIAFLQTGLIFTLSADKLLLAISGLRSCFTSLLPLPLLWPAAPPSAELLLGGACCCCCCGCCCCCCCCCC